MNEKIKELRKQAIIEKVDHYSWGDSAITHHLDEEKFAELIVKECARIDSKENNPDHVDGDTYNQTILRYFGVE